MNARRAGLVAVGLLWLATSGSAMGHVAALPAAAGTADAARSDGTPADAAQLMALPATVTTATATPATAWLAAAGATTAGSIAAVPVDTMPVELAPDDPGFYVVPEPIPAVEHGTLLRFQRIPDGGPNPGGAGVYRILYATTTVAGVPTVATGLVATGTTPPPVGGADVVLYGHGTTGLADVCAPSRAVGAMERSTYADGFQAMRQMANSGFMIVAADYEGIGGPGLHPFVVGVSEGRSMLDAGRAARQLPGVNAGPRTAVVGVSQGGHAAWWATHLAPEWTPEQPILASVLSAAGTEVVSYVRRGRLDEQFFQAGAVAAVAGMAAAYPEAAAALGTVLNERGQQFIATLDQVCFRDIVDGIVAVPSGNPFIADPTEHEPFASLLRANTAGAVATGTPMLVLHPADDYQVPLSQSEEFFARVCGTGQVVERRVSPGGHDVALYGALMEGEPWITAIFAGAPPVTSCPAPLPPPPPPVTVPPVASTIGAVVEFTPDDAAFYVPPDPLPAVEHGQLLRTQRINDNFVRLMYLSADSSGDPIAATAVVATPRGEAPLGGYSLLLVGEEPAGLADHCAASALAGTFGNDLRSDLLARLAAGKGFVVVAADGVGVGVPGPAEFLVGSGAGRTLLDAGLAARQVNGLYIGAATAVTGFGIGGHTALWAAHLAPTWTPTQPLGATLLAAPVSDLISYLAPAVADDGRRLPTITLAAVAGLAATSPVVAAVVGAFLTSEGAAAAAALEQHCFDEVDDPFEPAIAVPPGGVFAADPTATPPFAELFAAGGFPGGATSAPMLIFHGALDPDVPLAVSDALLAQLCAAGQIVERRVGVDEYHAISQSHADTDGLDWITGVLAGTVTPTSSCPA